MTANPVNHAAYPESSRPMEKGRGMKYKKELDLMGKKKKKNPTTIKTLLGYQDKTSSRIRKLKE